MKEPVNEKIINNLSQMHYEFSCNSLSTSEIQQLKQTASNNRFGFGVESPIGTNIFSSMERIGDIVFILQNFSNPNFDAMIINYKANSEKKYIVINKKKPLINQIFAAAHEYYHYLFGFQNRLRDSIVCSFNKNDNEEVKANRFAAELLLPQNALNNEVYSFLRYSVSDSLELIPKEKLLVLLYGLVIKYCLPLKAVIYRLNEEGLLDDIDEFLKNYDEIKEILVSFVDRFENVKNLYSNKNPFIQEPIYDLLGTLYEQGRIDKMEVEKIAKQFSLKEDAIKKIVPPDDEKNTLSDPEYKIDFGAIK